MIRAAAPYDELATVAHAVDPFGFVTVDGVRVLDAKGQPLKLRTSYDARCQLCASGAVPTPLRVVKEYRHALGREMFFHVTEPGAFYEHRLCASCKQRDRLSEPGASGVITTQRKSTGAIGASKAMTMESLGIFTFPTGLSYCDTSREKNGDYVRVAFLSFSTLALEWSKGRHPAEMRQEIEKHAATVTARRGEKYQVSTSGQTVTLGKG